MKTIRSTKKRLLIILLTGFVILFVMLLMQTMGDKYSKRVYVPWLWFSLLYIIPLLVLYQIRSSAQKIRSTGLILLTVLFTATTLLTILLQGLVPIPEGELQFKSRARTLWTSLLFLFPLELLLVYLFRNKLRIPRANRATEDPIPPDPKVFISYNHSNSETAKKIQEVLQKAEIDVIIDKDNMLAGDSIKEFIENSIRDSTVTLSLVSNESLKSAWVAMETIDTFFHERYMKHRKFIACYLDDDFFQAEYTLQAVDEIDK